ncbi:MAG TPA: sulfatase [Tepidisphaeraceae bacterium]|nr:sulfatase [Tepidisphaeraceae bacterium]
MTPLRAALLILALLPSLAFAQRKPNVVLIFCDDLGYGDLACFGSKTIATPNLDKLATQGMRLTDFHTDSPVCTPSRAALLTGSHAARIGLEKHVLFPRSRIGLSPSEVTIAKLLKGQGYATAAIGKWHLGDAPEFLPTAHGFDSYFGVPYSNDMRVKIGEKVGPPLMRNAEVIEHPADQTTLTERYADEAVKFITASKDKPFFLYLPHTFPHVPLFVSEKFKGKSKGGLYGDVVETLDWSVGRITDALKELGLEQDTIVIFTSDNGPWLVMKDRGGSAGPLRDGKGTVYEGGHRVACIVRWPGKVPAGAECSELASTMDLYPTLAKLAGASVPSDRVIDGRDIAPLLMGQAGAKTPHEVVFHHSANGPLHAVRAGPWKLHLPRTQPARKNAQGKEIPAVDRPAELYDLSKDLGESKNVSAENADVVARLTKLAEEHLAELAKNSRAVGRVAGAKETEKGANDK